MEVEPWMWVMTTQEIKKHPQGASLNVLVCKYVAPNPTSTNAVDFSCIQQQQQPEWLVSCMFSLFMSFFLHCGRWKGSPPVLNCHKNALFACTAMPLWVVNGEEGISDATILQWQMQCEWCFLNQKERRISYLIARINWMSTQRSLFE